MKRLVVIALTILLAGTAWADWSEAEPLLILAAQESRAATNAARAGSDEESLELWKRSLALTEEAYSVRGDKLAHIYLGHLAQRAFQAEEFAKAEDYANRALAAAAATEEPFVVFTGDEIHHGHLVLGMLALRDDDVEAAGARLLEAGKTHGSAVLGSFGPNMTLARLLLERGERDVVLEYFNLCRVFWKSGVERGLLDRWSLVVRNGGMPEFAANLVYGF